MFPVETIIPDMVRDTWYNLNKDLFNNKCFAQTLVMLMLISIESGGP